ncbi:MAG: SCP2 sterol-binding domain-containing protein [Anaerolineales bacterium]|jgi:putative sterol carrier protein
MSIAFPSEAWLKALMDQLNQSQKYRETGKDWEGDMCVVLDPDGTLKDPVGMYLDLWHGACRSARVLAAGETPKAAFVLRAPYSRFVDVLQGKLDPITAMMSGRLSVKGNMAVMMRNIPTVLQFVKECRALDTDFAGAVPRA